MAAQHSRYGDYSTRYRFNGKEQDEATGFYYYGARYYAPSLSRWLSIDPLAEKYQGFSPYNYTLNNPINLVAPDGRSVEDIVIKGKEKKKAFAELQKAVKNSVQLKMDESGLLSYKIKKGAVLSYYQQKLLTAIDDNCVLTVLNTTKKSTYKGGLFVGGAFLGNTVMKDGDYDVATNHVVNPYVTEAIDSYYKNPGATMLHEAVESYRGGVASQESGVSAGNANVSPDVYDNAHNGAPPQGGNVYRRLYNKNGDIIQNEENAVKAEWYVQQGDVKVIQTINANK